METVLFVEVWLLLGVLGGYLALKKFWDDFGGIEVGLFVFTCLVALTGPISLLAALIFRVCASNKVLFKKKDNR